MRDLRTLVETQMAKWRAQREDWRRYGGSFEPPNVVTLSNQLGSHGIEIARMVGERLHIPVYDREIVEHIANDDHLRVETVEAIDQRSEGRLRDYVAAIFRDQNYDQGIYVQTLTRTITAFWGHGPCVLIGRGGNVIVAREHALSVRTVARTDTRVLRIADRDVVDRTTAERRVHRVDAERGAFMQRYFGTNIEDAANYDLVVNTTGVSADHAADIVVSAYKAKFHDHPLH